VLVAFCDLLVTSVMPRDDARKKGEAWADRSPERVRGRGGVARVKEMTPRACPSLPVVSGIGNRTGELPFPGLASDGQQRRSGMKRTADAQWSGSLKDGNGTLDMQSGAFSGQPYTFKGRFVDEAGRSGTNPEELIAAAHAGCFAMQLSHFLAENGTPPERLDVRAEVELVPGTVITGSALTLRGAVPGITEARFQELAAKAKEACPVSKALGAISVTLVASLV
jgi:osmotically inducible protein OsmC